jgi:hypothetical protein
LPIIANTFRVANEYHVGATTFVNVWNLRSEGTPDPVTVGEDFITAYTATGPTSLSGIHSQSVTFDKVAVTAYDGTAPTVEVPYPGSTFGGGVLGPTPAQVAGIITLNTERRGRSFRGRVYLGGLPDSLLESDGSRWTVSFATDVTPMMEAFVNQLLDAAAVYTPCIVSIKESEGTDVATFTPRRYTGTIRRRSERAE